jgi:hypothetical protein
MLRKLRSRLSYANVVATMALFVAVGTGGAYAANTVFSTDIVDGEVKSVDIGNNEIGSADVKDNTINTFDVHSFLGVDVVDETLTGADIRDGTVDTGDLQDGGVYGSDIADSSLIDRDIAVSNGAQRGVTGSIGVVPAQSCVKRAVTGGQADRDHLLLTPNADTASPFLQYSAEWHDPPTGDLEIKVCNPTTGSIDDGTTRFNLIVINGKS